MKISGAAKRLSESILTALLAGSAGIVIWASRRGWDFIDGGTYFLSYKYPSDVVDLHTSYHLPAGWFFRLVGENIVYFRLLSWLLVGAAVWVFKKGFLDHLRAIWPDDLMLSSEWVFSTFLLLAGLAPFISAPAALTYNSLNVVCMFVAVGLLLSGSSRILKTASQNRRGWLEIAGACLVTGIDLALKPTTSILLFGAMSCFCLLSPVIPLRFKAVLGGLIVACCTLGVAIIAIFLGSWSALTLRLTDLLQISRNSAYKHELLARVSGDFQNLGDLIWSDLRLPMVAVLIAAIVVIAKPSTARSPRFMLGGFGIAIGVIWLGVATYERLWQAAHDYFLRAAISRLYLEAIIICGALIALFRLGSRRVAAHPTPVPGIAIHLALLSLLLVTLPFAGAFGTTNPIYLNAGFQASCWAAAVILLLVIIAQQFGVPMAVPIAILPIAIFATAQFINGDVLHPYGLRTNLFGQNTPTAVGSPSTSLLLDAPTSHFIQNTRQILEANGFKPGDDIFAFFNLPGLVFAVGGRSPIIPWYFGRIYAGNTIEESYMQMAGAERRRHAWVITQADATIFHEHYLRGGLNFPNGYEVIGDLTSPATAMDIKIWKIRAASN